MLGGQQPPDRELIKSWMRRDWADNLYPGADQRRGPQGARRASGRDVRSRTERRAAGRARRPPDRGSQKTLARLSVAAARLRVAEIAGALIAAGDWIAARKGGPDVGRRVRGGRRQPLDTVRVPGFFTYSGFQQLFIAQLRRYRRAHEARPLGARRCRRAEPRSATQYDDLRRRSARALYQRFRRRLARRRWASCG